MSEKDQDSNSTDDLDLSGNSEFEPDDPEEQDEDLDLSGNTEHKADNSAEVSDEDIELSGNSDTKSTEESPKQQDEEDIDLSNDSEENIEESTDESDASETENNVENQSSDDSDVEHKSNDSDSNETSMTQEESTEDKTNETVEDMSDNRDSFTETSTIESEQGFNTVNDSGSEDGVDFKSSYDEPDSEEDAVEFSESEADFSSQETGKEESSDLIDDGDVERGEDDTEEESSEEDDTLEDIEFIEDSEDDKEEKSPEEDLKEYDTFIWQEQIEDFVETIKNVQDRDPQSVTDLKTAPGRIYDYFKTNPKARDNFWDILLPLNLVFYGLILTLAVLVTGSGSWANIILTEPSVFADIFALDLLLMSVAIILLAVARGKSDFSNPEVSQVDRIRRISRIVITGLHILPSVLLIGVLYLVFGGGLETAQAWQEQFYSIFNLSILPDSIAGVIGTIVSISPTGITIQIIGLLMLGIGIIGTIPFSVGIFKLILIAVNIGSNKQETDVDDVSTNKLLGGQIGAAPRQEASIDTEDPSDYGELPDLGATGEVQSLLKSEDDYLLEPYPNYIERERYWLRKPYCYAVILENKIQGDIRYFVVEPTLNDRDRRLYNVIVERVDTKVLYEDLDEDKADDMLRDEKAEILREKVAEITTETGMDSELTNTSFAKIMYYIERNFVDYGKIDPFMNDPNIEDISCDGPNKPVVVYHQEHDDLYSNIQFEDPEMLEQFIIQLAQRSGEQITKSNPLQDASLPDGSRAQLTLGDEVTTEGSTFTIRQFQEVPFSPVDLLRYNTFNLKQMAYLWLAIKNNKSLIFAGGTASGKTTSMNAVSLFIPPKKKIVSLEDTRELTLPHEHWIPGVTKEGSGDQDGDDVSMFHLLEAALRQRPEYLIVGEVRGEEAVTLFQAMSTGHTTYSTMHADSVQTAFNRLKNPPIEVPAKMLQALDIMCIQLRTNIKDDDGEWKTVRRNAATSEIEEVYQDREAAAEVNPAFEWDPERDKFISRLDESQILKEIEREQGWSYQEVRDDIKDREKVLNYMLEEDVRDIEKVTRVIQAFMINRSKVMKGVEQGNLDIEGLRDIENLDLDNLRDPEEIQNDQLLEDLEG